jgi:hypothetical protein
MKINYDFDFELSDINEFQKLFENSIVENLEEGDKNININMFVRVIFLVGYVCYESELVAKLEYFV